jgi:hypothetical protein
MGVKQMPSHDECLYEANLKAHEDRKVWRKRIESELIERMKNRDWNLVHAN